MTRKTNELINELTNNLEPVQHLPSIKHRFLRWFVPAFLATAILTGLSIAVSGNFHPLSGRFLTEQILLLATTLMAARSALQLTIPQAWRQSLYWWPLGLGLLWLAVLFAVSLTSTKPGFISSLDVSWHCVFLAALFTALPVWLLRRQVRIGAILKARWTGLLTLSSAAAMGALGLQFACPVTGTGHVFLWHLLPAYLLAAAGYGLGKSLFK